MKPILCSKPTFWCLTEKLDNRPRILFPRGLIQFPAVQGRQAGRAQLSGPTLTQPCTSWRLEQGSPTASLPLCPHRVTLHLFPISHPKGKQAKDGQGGRGLWVRRPSTQQLLQLRGSGLATVANSGALQVPPTLLQFVPLTGMWKIFQVLDGETATSAQEDLSSSQVNATVLDYDGEHNRKACCRLDLVLNKRQIIYFFLQMKHNTKV